MTLEIQVWFRKKLLVRAKFYWSWARDSVLIMRTVCVKLYHWNFPSTEASLEP